MATKRPRLICFARDLYPLHRADVAVLFGKYLSKDLDVTWCVRGSDGHAGVHEDDVGSVRVSTSWPSFFAMHLKATREILAGSYDGVQCRDLIVISAWYAFISSLAKVPFIYWMSFQMELGYLELAKRYRALSFSRLSRLGIGQLGRFLLKRYTLPRARFVFVQSDLMKQRVAELGVDPDRMLAVPMGFDPVTYNPEQSEASIEALPSNSKLILYVGTLDKERKLDIPFAAAARLMKQREEVHLAIAGNATEAEKSDVLRVFEPHGVNDRCHFLGRFEPLKLAEVVRRADVCLSSFPNGPLLDTATPTKLVEYIACGSRAVINHMPDHDFIAAHSSLARSVEFSVEGYEEGIEEALSQGRPSVQEQSRSFDWLGSQREYSLLADQCRKEYRKIFA